MASRRLVRIELETGISHKLAARGLKTAKDVLTRNLVDLMELLDEGMDAVEAAVTCISEAVCPQPQTALELLGERRSSHATAGHLSTRLPPLDRALRGGIPANALTEVVGPAGIGKTQLCMMLSVFATLPVSEGGLGGIVVYIDTESKFNSHRLVEIGQSRAPASFDSEAGLQRLTTAVLLLTPASSQELLDRLQNMDEAIIEHGVKLIVVDSIAALVRSEYGRDRIRERQEMLGKYASHLKYLAETFHIPVLVTNQVMTLTRSSGQPTDYGFGHQSLPDDASFDPHTSAVTAALGTKWAHCVNVRLVLEAWAGKRFIKIAKAPMAPTVAFPYTIASGGVYLTEETEYLLEGGGLGQIGNEGTMDANAEGVPMDLHFLPEHPAFSGPL